MSRRLPQTDWVSQADAAAFMGCSPKTVEAMVAAGEIEHRPRCGGRPSLSRSSVLTAARAFRTKQSQRAQAAARRAAAKDVAAGRWSPPTPDEVWLDAETVARMLGWTNIWVARLAAEGRLPGVSGR